MLVHRLNLKMYDGGGRGMVFGEVFHARNFQKFYLPSLKFQVFLKFSKYMLKSCQKT